MLFSALCGRHVRHDHSSSTQIRLRRCVTAIACLALIVSGAAGAQAQALATDSTAPGVPSPLAPWVPWVRTANLDAACPVRDGQAVCFWPGALSLALRALDGNFQGDLVLDRRQLVRLPGASGRWPVAVRVSGKPVPVVAHAGGPVVDLPAGSHHIEGRFVWSHLPDQLPVPPEYGQLQVSLEGRPLPRPKREEDGSIWLRTGQQSVGPEQLELTVTRKIQDAVPMRIESRIRIRAAGEPREVSLGNVLLTDTVPLEIQSELPLRLDASGALRLQVRAGSYSLRVLARTKGDVRVLSSHARPAPWPDYEAWVFEPDTQLRQVRLGGVSNADPARLELDADLRAWPTFLVRANDKLTLDEVRRGEPDPAPNRLVLQRSFWLDQDGHGYTVRDQLSGELHSGFHLALDEGKLGRASLGGAPVVITQRTPQGPLGVEVRTVPVSLSADSRLEDNDKGKGKHGSLPAVGWSEDVRQLGVTLNLPPGYVLFGVKGVDHVDRSWLSNWNLFGFFLVLVVSFGTAAIAGPWAWIVAFCALALSYQEDGAPTAVWLWLLVFAALLRVLPRGRAWQLGRAGFVVTLAVLAAGLLPFAARSLREAIYPQLGQQGQPASFDVDEDVMRSAQPLAVDGEEEEEKNAKDQLAGAASEAAPASPSGALAVAKRMRRGDASAAASYAKPDQARSELDPETVVQTGPGLPDWHFRSWRLTWSGPVAHDHHFELILIPPALNRSLCVLRVALAAWLVWLLVAASGAFRAALQPSSPLSAAGTAAFLLCFAGAGVAHAQFPDTPLLDELRGRTTRPPACRPECSSVAELDVQVGPDSLVLRGEVHAQDLTSVRIPGPLGLWGPERVRLDGNEAHTVAHPDGFLHVRVTPGVHTLEASGPLPLADTLTLRFGDRPLRVRAHGVGYEVSGVREDGSIDDAIQLRRLLQPAEAIALSLPAWFSVTRSLEFNNEFRVKTTIERQTPTGMPELLHLPLLDSEAVQDSRVQVNGDEALIGFGPDDRLFVYESSLRKAADLKLTAAAKGAYSERWQFSCGSMWQCDATGLVPVSRELGGEWLPQFRPWPGEKLQIHLQKPTAASGQTTTIDSVTLRLRPGVRSSDGELRMSLRTSRGGEHTFYLPARARLQSLTIAGTRRAVQHDGDAYAFSVLPGSSEIVAAFELPLGAANVLTLPQTKLAMRARNVRVIVQQPNDRWLLWVRGPAWGPAILFWGYLVLALGAALLLGRLRTTPLGTFDWLLLAAGLTQVGVLEALGVVVFFTMIAARARTHGLGRFRHNLLQLVLIAAALVFGSVLFEVVRSGLLVTPDMQVAGVGSQGNTLQWYVDESGPALPTPTIISVPLWVYRMLMLAWSLWLARRLLSWAPWAYAAFSVDGLWKSKQQSKRPPPASVAPMEPPQPAE